eukprot:CAMPEP_0198724548 /NCGR_PEP_ID=MMETSP1475-20131203/2008_1 /TAXON_ID= ORGANISM="Unidentified sp., Strain CCMP1999" /NCGR_SAMPLE_ID=MMETSP1475 /ASSEMBLY_ACC=CAM_ASM_001111 /LENGTH=821 /DNA_ID=CAMNT_0044486109 /DNA_START=180 /DNA_END=2645 /DNA_ORIENTATION=+
MAVDLGAQFFKVAVIKPGSGLDIALNEQSKRKTPSAVAFTDDEERLFGDTAVTYSTKFPERSILNFRADLGAIAQLEDGSLARKNLSVEIGEKTTELPPEGATAMILTLAKKFASSNIGNTQSADSVRDCVITVPSWFDEAERGCLVDSAKLANLNIIGLINTNTATALKFLFDTKEKTVNQTIMIYDVGASGASASIFKISRESSGRDEVLTVENLAHEWNQQISGFALDEILSNYMAEKFDESKQADDPSVKTIPRIMSRLRKEVQRLREVLSANSEALFSVESLFADRDFRTKILRSDFEVLAENVFSRVMDPVNRALEKARLKSEDLDGVIPFGGVSRTPKIQATLMDGLNIDYLNKSINSDEAAVLGSLWYGASTSSLVKSRKVNIVEKVPKSISVAVGREKTSSKKDTQQTSLFAAGTKYPQRKTINLKRKSDFNITLFYDEEQDPSIAVYQMQNVESVLKKLQDSSTLPTPKVSLTFNLDKSGLVEILKSEASVEETILVEKAVETNDTNTKSADASSTDASASAGVTASESPSESTAEKTNGQVEKVPKLTVHRVSLTKKLERNGAKSLAGRRLSPSDIVTTRLMLSRLEEADRKRKERADSLNSLESAIFQLREKLYEEELEAVSTEKERDRVRRRLDETEDWLFTEEASTSDKHAEKEKMLRDMVTKLWIRATEMEDRPKAVAVLQKAIEIANSTCTLTRQAHEEKKSPEIGKIDDFRKEVESAAEFLASSLEAQSGKLPRDDPAFLSKDLTDRAIILTRGAAKVQKLRLPKDPTPTASTSPSESESTSTESESSTEDPTATEAEEAKEDL